MSSPGTKVWYKNRNFWKLWAAAGQRGSQFLQSNVGQLAAAVLVAAAFEA
jgi:hypothetical protein